MEQTTSPPKPDTEPNSEHEATPQPLTKAQKRRQEFLEQARERSGYEFKWLLKRAKNVPLIFDTVKGPIQGELRHFGVFRFNVKTQPKRKPIRLEKLSTFTISAAEDQEHLQQHLKIHQPTRAKGLTPQPGAARNPPIPKGLVEKAIQKKKQLALMLLNGTIVVGIPIAESFYSILLKVPDANGEQLFIFKHGLMGARLYEEIKPS